LLPILVPLITKKETIKQQQSIIIEIKKNENMFLKSMKTGNENFFKHQKDKIKKSED
jgi:hypothetical protein